jgi:hypothetical protein
MIFPITAPSDDSRGSERQIATNDWLHRRPGPSSFKFPIFIGVNFIAQRMRVLDIN